MSTFPEEVVLLVLDDEEGVFLPAGDVISEMRALTGNEDLASDRGVTGQSPMQSRYPECRVIA